MGTTLQSILRGCRIAVLGLLQHSDLGDILELYAEGSTVAVVHTCPLPDTFGSLRGLALVFLLLPFPACHYARVVPCAYP